ncbi:dethiobiotin synthase [Gordonia malaquae]|uniref:dethiobiotin synthase n=1 Tax=Gordonia malaquae TaxID=410332 RepID=UPI0030FEBBB2
MTARIVVVTGTGTDVGKTIAVAALAASARANGLCVGVCKPAQTGIAPGEPGDLAVVTALAGDVSTREPARYPEPLAPETAARRAGLAYVTLDDVHSTVSDLAQTCDLVIVEGAGGVLVRLAPDLTVLDLARDLGAQILVVTDPGLGTLNHTELTVREIRRAGLGVDGLIIGAWPPQPDLAMTCNRDDLQRLTGVPIVATLPAGAGSLDPAAFQINAPTWVRSPITSPTTSQPGVHP